MLFLVDLNNQENVAEAPGFQDLLIQLKHFIKHHSKRAFDHFITWIIWRKLLKFCTYLTFSICLGIFLWQILINYFSSASNFKVQFKNQESEMETPTVTFCFNPGLKVSALEISSKIHDGDYRDYKMGRLFYTNNFIVGPIQNSTDILRDSFFKLGEDFNLVSDINAYGMVRPTMLKEGLNYMFNPITKKNDLEIKVQSIITATLGLCYQAIPSFRMSPKNTIFFKVIFNSNMLDEDKPKVNHNIVLQFLINFFNPMFLS